MTESSRHLLTIAIFPTCHTPRLPHLSHPISPSVTLLISPLYDITDVYSVQRPDVGKTPVMVLQEHCQKQMGIAPVYTDTRYTESASAAASAAASAPTHRTCRPVYRLVVKVKKSNTHFSHMWRPHFSHMSKE